MHQKHNMQTQFRNRKKQNSNTNKSNKSSQQSPVSHKTPKGFYFVATFLVGYATIAVMLFGATITTGLIKEGMQTELTEYLYNETADLFSWWILPSYLLLWKLPVFIIETLEKMKHWLLDIIDRILNYVFGKIFDCLKIIFDFTVDIITTIYHSYLFQQFLIALQECYRVMKDVFFVIFDFTVEVFRIISDIIVDVICRLEIICTKLWELTEGVRNLISFVIDIALEVVNNLLQTILGFLHGVMVITSELIAKVWNTVIEVVNKVTAIVWNIIF